ncbi:MAG: hypothetical protein IT342_27500 [Candidatus Melainabacteria bacterium]|nr:hypothetical protein [Candidatus Melainabacteria bacterium]
MATTKKYNASAITLTILVTISCPTAPCQGAQATGDSGQVKPLVCKEPQDLLNVKSNPIPPIQQDEGIDEVPGRPDFEDSLHALNCRILLKEIEFAKFNIRFKQQGNVQGRWRGLRYFAWQETNALMTLSGLIGQIVARERSLANTTRKFDAGTGQVTARPRPLNRRAIQLAACSQMIGQQIGSIGALNELAINFYHSRQAKKHGYDQATALKKAASMRQQLKSLLAERQQLVESVILSPTQKEVLILEGEVLKDICDLTFDEYRRFHISNAKFRTFQNALYLGDFAKASVGWPGNLLGILAQANRNPHLGYPNGILVATSGAIVAANPFVARGLGKLVEIRTRKKLNQEFGDTERQDLDDLEEDTKKLKAALIRRRQFGSSPLLACEDRISLYETENISRQKQVDLASREIRAGQRTATQNILSAQIVGNTKMANGITGMVAGFRYPRVQRANFPLVVDGQITYLAGAGFGAADNIRIQIQAEINRRKLKRQRLLPSQIYGDRMKALEDLEKRINSPL